MLANRLRLSPYSRSFIRTISTEHSQHNPLAPPPLPATNTQRPQQQRTQFLNPSPRSSAPSTSHNGPSYNTRALPHLPPHFGRNQVLSVPDSTRALLEEITHSFNAPIRYAFAYGSGVFKQDGYSQNGPKPQLDFVFAVNHPDHWHSMNLTQNPSHYPLHARLLGSSFISKFQRISPGIWFNTLVPMNGVMVKYGVTTVDNLCSDLLNWDTLYLSGRMHKPIRIIKDDARVRLTQQVNLVSALRVALLTLPQNFTEVELFERMTRFSYAGDPRMSLPAENKGKVGNIVRAQGPQFKELYHRLATGLPGVHWDAHSSNIEQDTSPRARSALIKKLPANLIRGLEKHYVPLLASSSDPSSSASDPSAFWLQAGSDEKLGQVINTQLESIVRRPATVQSAKGIVSAGFTKSIRYGAAKVGKWWSSSSSTSSSSSP